MNLLRFLAISLFIWLLVAVVRGYLRRTLFGRKLGKPAPIGAMVRCQQCSLHVPETEAFRRGDRYYCSIQHRDAD